MEFVIMDSMGVLTKNYMDYCKECEKNGEKAKGLIGFLKNMVILFFLINLPPRNAKAFLVVEENFVVMSTNKCSFFCLKLQKTIKYH